MKGIIISGSAAIVTIVFVLILYGILKKWNKGFQNMPRKKRVILMCLVWLVIFFSGAVIYFGHYYHSGETAAAYMASHDGVEVISNGNGYLFDGPGETDALIFYPGAKVEADAYAPVLFQLAEGGVDCFLVEMPFHMAFFGRNSAASIIEENHYEHWYLGGHSLGGAIAASYVAEHAGDFDGLILLASYPPGSLPENLDFCSIYGSNDGVMNRKTYEEEKLNWPVNGKEVIIKGGNHAQFGDYGAQSGDNPADISAKEQQTQTVEAVLEMIYK